MPRAQRGETARVEAIVELLDRKFGPVFDVMTDEELLSVRAAINTLLTASARANAERRRAGLEIVEGGRDA